MKKHPITTGRHRQRGQSLVEMCVARIALVLTPAKYKAVPNLASAISH